MDKQYYRPAMVSIDGSTDPNEIIQGYTDGSTCNGWLNVAFTKVQLTELMKTTPYDLRFTTNKAGIESATLYFEDEITIESSPLFLEDGTLLTVYFMGSYYSYCFIEMENGESLS